MEFELLSLFIFKVVLSLALILIINRITDKLYLAVACGTVFLGILSGHGYESMSTIVLDKVLSPNTFFLMVAVFQVICLSSQMSDAGVMKDLVSSVNIGFSKKTSMAVLPAVIGLLPMPGGALFSAPLVDECDNENGVGPLQKTLINYWFRHIWEYWWPLYPGVLLAVDLTGMSILNFMLIQFPLSIVSVLAGYIFILRKIGNVKKEKIAGCGAVVETFTHLAPVIIIIVFYTVINVFVPFLAEFNKYIPMIGGIIFAQSYLQIKRPLPFNVWRSIFVSAKTFKLLFLVLLILIYGAFISSPLPDGSFIMDHMKNELSSLGIPLFYIIMFIPFISGITTGLAVGFVGASFPIVVSLAGGDISYYVLAYGCGYMGMMLSPVHVCLIVTAEHFNTDISRTIRSLFYPAVSVMTVIILIHLLYRISF